MTAAPLVYADALARVLAGVTPGDSEALPSQAALGRILRTPVIANDALPPFDNSAMDGYALRLGGTPAPAGTRFPVQGAQFAGEAAQAGHGVAIEITTGALLPSGFDSIVPVEQVVNEPGAIVLREDVAPGRHIRRRGEDVAAGTRVLEAGRLLDVPALSILAALGVASVDVARRPRVALIATGRELVDDPALPLAPGQIRNSNRPTLALRMVEAGAELVYAATIGDEVPALIAAVHAARAAGAEIVLSSGAVSMGRHDFVPAALHALGAEIVFHKLRMRPGKPLLFARLADGTPYVGLPGNPVSSAVGFRFFVEPWLRARLGLPPEQAVTLPLEASLPARAGLRFHNKARLRLGANAGLRVEILAGQESFRIAPLLAATCWAIQPEDAPDLPAGAPIAVLPPGHLLPLTFTTFT